MRKMNSEFRTKFISEAGSRLQNKDYFAYVELDFCGCYVLADGIDEDMELASAKLAVEAVLKAFLEKPACKKKTAKKLLQKANEELINRSNSLGLKCSLALVLTDYTHVIFASTGNTRFYLWRNESIYLRSVDQSITGELVEKEALALDKVASHMERNNLYCYVGKSKQYKPSITRKIKLIDGDIITLLTRGIWENIDDGEITDAISEATEPIELLNHVEDVILSKQPKELENYTLATVYVDKVYIESEEKKKKRKKIIKWSIIVLILLLIISLIIYILHRVKVNRIEAMSTHIEDAVTYVEHGNYVRAGEEYGDALALSKKVRMKEKSRELSTAKKLMEQIVLGDTRFKDLALQEAYDTYREAREVARITDPISTDYIEEQLTLLNGYINANDYMDLGHLKLEAGDLEGAMSMYQKAKEESAKVYDTAGKKEAFDKVLEVQAMMAERQKEAEAKVAEEAKQAQEAKAKEEEAQAKEEEDKAKAEEEDNVLAKLRIEGLENEKTADMHMKLRQYDDGLLYYELAKELYQQAGMQEKANQVAEKVILTKKKIESKDIDKERAQVFGEEASKKFIGRQLYDAKMLYLLAKDIYQSIDAVDEVAQVDEKIALIDSMLEEQGTNNGTTNSTNQVKENLTEDKTAVEDTNKVDSSNSEDSR